MLRRHGRRVHTHVYFFILFIIFALIFALPSIAAVVTQIRGHIAGSGPPSRLQFVPCIFIATRLQQFLPSSTRVEHRPIKNEDCISHQSSKKRARGSTSVVQHAWARACRSLFSLVLLQFAHKNPTPCPGYPLPRLPLAQATVSYASQCFDFDTFSFFLFQVPKRG